MGFPEGIRFAKIAFSSLHSIGAHWLAFKNPVSIDSCAMKRAAEVRAQSCKSGLVLIPIVQKRLRTAG